MPNIDDIYKSKYTGEEIDELLDKVQLQDFTYDSLKDKPIINQDLLIGGFTPQENTYYRHTGSTTLGFANGIIYLYSGGKYTSIKGGGGGGGYILPVATGTRLGGVKIGDGLEITEDGTLSAKSTGGVGKQGTGTGAEIFNSYEGEYANVASGNFSHAEGYHTKALKEYSHAEGLGSEASGSRSHAEGESTIASGAAGHAEGGLAKAIGSYSHAEGLGSEASGNYSHAEGYATKSSGIYSHAEGYYTKASGEKQHVQGKYNVEDTENKYAHIVGNGESEIARSNAHTLDWQGNAWYAGKVSGGTPESPAPVENANDYVTKKHFDENKIEVVDNLTTNDATKALSAKQGVWLNDVNEALTAPVKVGDNLTALYFDTEKTPDLSIFTYTLDENMGFYTAGLIGLRASEIVGYLSAVKVNDTVYALIYENRATGDISYLYVSDNIEYGGTSFSKGWQNFNNPFPVTSATVVDVDQTATKPWNGVWVSKKAFYARTDEIPAEPNNGTLTIQKNGTTVGTFGANQSENTTANIDVPTKVSQLQNDAGYTKNKGTVISILLNGTTYTADANGLVDLGTISDGTVYRSIYNSIY